MVEFAVLGYRFWRDGNGEQGTEFPGKRHGEFVERHQHLKGENGVPQNNV